MDHPPILIEAAWIAPMTGPPVRDGAVVIHDRRLAGVGAAKALRREHPYAIIHDAGNAVILPGLINAHTHLELSLQRQGDRPKRFVDWIIDLMHRTDPSKSGDAMSAGIHQCLRFGVTMVGDITAQPAITRPILTASPLRGISFGEVRAMAQRRSLLQPRLNAAIERINSSHMAAGISPHAPYSIEIDGYEKCLESAIEHHLPITTHLAETADEAEFLEFQRGPFKELWDALNAWDQSVPRFIGGPIRFAKHLGLLDYPTLLAHVNYCDDDELDLLSKGKASVVYCPRTHDYFGHPPHRWRDMLARGINVCIGTDSCASSPDLNLVDDLRLLHKLAPEIAPIHLWELVTTKAALAMRDRQAGSLSVGSFADMAVFPIQTSDPLKEILESSIEPSQVWIGGDRQIQFA